MKAIKKPMNNKQQTAVEWLEMKIVELEKEFAIPSNIYTLCEQAKEIERHIRIRAYEQGIMETRKIMAFENKTIAQKLYTKIFPFEIYDENGNVIYDENSSGGWSISKFDSDNKCIFYENSVGGIFIGTKLDAEGNEISGEKSETKYFTTD